ncbi:MAG: DoxX family protein [Anaerolineales bacterium]|jgi:uncharacterized membrane protein YphA (DoxX/SURF4 family)|nr:DoxX family protein [Anaerolineales bacterium]MBX3004630.1 DoxX family protein [Anaerolineales bacterium]
MATVLWIVQALLGLMFIGAGAMHAFQAETMAKQPPMAWLAAVPKPLMTFIGLAEIAGGLGLLLPMPTGIAPWLTPLAAALLAVVMLAAIVFHLRRKEYPNIGINVVLLLLAALVAWGRWGLF